MTDRHYSLGKSGTGGFGHFCFLLLVGLLASGCSVERHENADFESAAAEIPVSQLQRIGERLFPIDSDKPFTGNLVDYYPDGALKSRSSIESGMLHETSEGYFPNGQLESRENFLHGVSHGTRIRFYENGKRRSEAEIVAGDFHGRFRRWHVNGSIAEETDFVHGVPHGESIAYFESGFIRARVSLADGGVTESRFYNDGEMPNGTLPHHIQKNLK